MAKTKTVYQYDNRGYYIGPGIAFESPLEPGVFLVPAGCVEIAPPAVTESNAAQWNGSQWQEVPAPVPEDLGAIQPEHPANFYVTWSDLETAYTEGVNA